MTPVESPALPAGLIWRCRRGMKELDLLLERFARERYASEPPARRGAFERLLALPDPVLVELLLLDPDPAMPPTAEAAAATADAELAAVAALVAAACRR